MITVEPLAAVKAQELLTKLGKPNLRIRILSGGCSGLEYKIEAANEPTEQDLVFTASGFGIVVDRRSVIYVAGAVLAYETQQMSSRFVLKNPNATSTCSCGESFSV